MRLAHPNGGHRWGRIRPRSLAMSSPLRLLFPDPPRDFAVRRGLKVLLRSAHVLCAGVFVGAHVFGADAVQRTPWLVATLATGFAILLLDLHESAAFLLQVRGAVVLVKLAVLALLPQFGEYQAAVLCALVVVSVCSSHAPSRIRYAVLVGRDKIARGRSKG